MKIRNHLNLLALLFSTVTVLMAMPYPFLVTAALAQTSEIPETKADQIFRRGIEQYQSNKIKDSIESLQEALAIYRRIENKIKVVNTLEKIGVAHFARTQFKDAANFHQEALMISEKIGYREGKARSLNSLGNALGFGGDQKKAIESHEAALEIARKINSREEEVRALNGLGNDYNSPKTREKSIEFYETSLRIAKSIVYQEGESKSLVNLSGIYIQSRQYEKGIELAKETFNITQKNGDKRTEVVSLIHLGTAYNQLGRYKEVIELSNKILKNYEELEDREGKFVILTNLGISYRHLGLYDEALKVFQSCLKIAEGQRSRHNRAMSLGNLGVTNYFLGRNKQSIEYEEQALDIYRDLKFREGEGLTLTNIGLPYASLGEHEKAISYYQESLKIAIELNDKLREGNALHNIGVEYFELKRYPDSSNNLLHAIEVYEKYLRSGRSDTNKISILDTYSRSYIWLQKTLVAQNKFNEALQVAENSRAKALTELLSSKQSGNLKSNSETNYLEITEIQKIARENRTTIVTYSVSISDLYIWVVKPTGDILFRQVALNSLDTDSLSDLVLLSRKSIGVRGNDADVKLVTKVDLIAQENKLKQLHKLLIEPIADLLPPNPTDRVTFIPQGPLFLVPFAALQDQNGKYLIEQHTILSAPSIQVLDLTHRQRQALPPTNQPRILVAGNPTIPTIKLPGADTALILDPLSGANQEAIDVADGFNTKALTGKQATKQAIVQQMPTARIIHLATHGLLNDFKGLGVPGAIVLGADGTGQPNDGLLTADEILGMKLQAELVVLSACNTGQGTLTGDGVIGLSRSLISAGVPSVVVSLWAVDDTSTSQLMPEFYRQLKQQPDKAQALRQAMLTTMKSHPNPIDWAAFTLIGESE
jgi:CHAT domain-containing protein